LAQDATTSSSSRQAFKPRKRQKKKRITLDKTYLGRLTTYLASLDLAVCALT
jgi:hypothetical protein